MLKSIRRIARAGAAEGIGGATATIRHGLKWRAGRARRTLTGPFRRLRQSRNSGRPTVQMQSDQSIASANEALRTVGERHEPLRQQVFGPEFSVAIIVPTYRDSQYLGDALRSVQRQTYENWSCYVVDDASPEDVGAVFAEFETDPRFHLLRHGANGGLAAARNTGIRVATEDAIQFLDADDLLTPWSLARKVEDLRQHWNDPLVAGVHGQVLHCTEETTLEDLDSWTGRPSLGLRDWLASDGESPFTVHAPLTKASVVRSLGGFDEEFRNGAEDWDFWQRVLRHGFAFMPTRCVVGAYRQRKASMIREYSDIHLARADALFAATTEWADVDDEVAVSNARMPLSEGRLALQRLIRAARWAGIRMAQLKSIDDAIDEEILGFLDVGATVGTRRDDCYNAARGGVIRGLGLSTNIVSKLDRDTRAVIESAADELTDRLMAHCQGAVGQPGTICLDRRRHADVGLVADSLGDIASLAELHAQLEHRGLTVVAIDNGLVQGNSLLADAWKAHGVETVSYNSFALGTLACTVMVSRSPAHPSTLDLLTRHHAGQSYFLAEEAERVLLLDESATASISIDVAGVDEIADAARSSSRRVPDAMPHSDFSLLLPVEEDPIDPEGHAWLMDMYNSQRGETVVVIGNGPSLNDIDLDLLEGTHTFGVNSIFLADERFPEPLTYYVVEDTAVFKDNAPEIKAYEATHKLFPSLYRPKFDPGEITSNTHFFRMNMGFYGRTSSWGEPTRTLCHPRFSMDPSQRVFCGQSVTIINLQLAHWFGYERVVLIGMDFSYQIPSDAERTGNIIVSRSDDPNHFHPDYFGAGKTWKDPKLDRVLVNYRLADEVYRATDREIVNSTVGGNLHLFPRMDLADALKGK